MIMLSGDTSDELEVKLESQTENPWSNLNDVENLEKVSFFGPIMKSRWEYKLLLNMKG